MVETESETVQLSEAVAIYLRLKGQNRPDSFKRAAERSCGYLIDICGNKSITSYTRKDANTFRDKLIAKGLAGSSITRVFGTVCSIIKFAAAQIGVEINNPEPPPGTVVGGEVAQHRMVLSPGAVNHPIRR